MASEEMPPSDPNRLERTRRFFFALADRDTEMASAELLETATYHMPGNNPSAGTFRGRREIVAHFQRLFELTSGSEAVKWVDWMDGTDLVATLLRAHLQAGLIELECELLFVVGFDASGPISDVRLFLEDQACVDRFLAQLPTTSTLRA